MSSIIPEFRLSLLGNDIPVSTTKYLGVSFDSELSFDDHITITVSSRMSRLGQVNQVKHLFDHQTLIKVINTLVFSKLYYCSNVWTNTAQKNLHKLEAVPKSCLSACQWR